MATVSTHGKSVVSEFVAKLKERMRSLKLTPKAVAARAEVGYPYLYRVLKGEQSPSFEWAERVGKCVGLVIEVRDKEPQKRRRKKIS